MLAITKLAVPLLSCLPAGFLYSTAKTGALNAVKYEVAFKMYTTNKWPEVMEYIKLADWSHWFYITHELDGD